MNRQGQPIFTLLISVTRLSITNTDSVFHRDGQLVKDRWIVLLYLGLIAHTRPGKAWTYFVELTDVTTYSDRCSYVDSMDVTRVSWKSSTAAMEY